MEEDRARYCCTCLAVRATNRGQSSGGRTDTFYDEGSLVDGRAGGSRYASARARSVDDAAQELLYCAHWERFKLQLDPLEERAVEQILCGVIDAPSTRLAYVRPAGSPIDGRALVVAVSSTLAAAVTARSALRSAYSQVRCQQYLNPTRSMKPATMTGAGRSDRARYHCLKQLVGDRHGASDFRTASSMCWVS